MFLRSCTFLFLLITFSVFGQNVNTPASTAIKANFTMASVKAYQESATLKVEDYYQYLTLLSSESTSETLKAEIKNSIYSLFESENIRVIDFTSTENTTILLTELIDKIANKNFSFSVTNFENSIVATDYWTTQYQLTITQNKIPMEFQYYQKIGFKPIVKSFGTTKKEVWTLFLGEITLPQ
jgi:disulfide oxidoreductase YuzD